MNKKSVVFLQGAVVLVGVIALALLLWEPHLEGRNAGASLFQIYFHDPFLAYAYIASAPFFVALFHLFRILRLAGDHKLFSRATADALRTIKYCAVILIGFVAVGEVFIVAKGDEPLVGLFMGFLVVLGSGVIAAAATVAERVLRKSISIKPNNT